MAIRINDDYQLVPDGTCYQLQQRRKPKKPKPGEAPKGEPQNPWSFVGYWPNLTQLCDAMAERHLLKGEWASMREAVHQIQRLRDETRQAVLMLLPENAADYKGATTHEGKQARTQRAGEDSSGAGAIRADAPFGSVGFAGGGITAAPPGHQLALDC